MTAHTQAAIDISLPLAILDVCPVNLLSRAKPVKRPHGVPLAGLTKCSYRHLAHLPDDADSPKCALASTVVASGTFQNP
jgi:hypothetical protein